MKSFILLENIVLYAYHGVYEQETRVGNSYIINLKLDVDLEKATKSDSLDDTINYGIVYDVVKKEMSIPSKLLEHVGGRIMNALRSRFDQIQHIELRISKRNPPITGQMDCASILLMD